MNKLLALVVVVGVVIFRLLMTASQLGSTTTLGPLAKLPKSWRRWLFDERNSRSN